MIAAYVDGRPIPRSSSALTSVASVNRAGGLVACPSASSERACSSCPTCSAGRRRSSSSSLGSSLPSSYALRKPGNVITVPEAANSASVPVRGRRAEPDRHRLPARVLHLRRDRPLPDQVVQRVLVARELALELARRPEGLACRADRLVGLLRVLHLSLVPARLRGHGLGAVELGRLRAGGAERDIRQRRRVGAHVGDVTRSRTAAGRRASWSATRSAASGSPPAGASRS